MPPEFAGRADDYIDAVCEWLPQLHAEGLVDAVDAFCEGIGFSPAQTRRVFEAARALGLPVKLHADQLSDLGGAALTAEFDGLSADHVEHTSLDSVRAMAEHGTVAVLLPGAFHVLRETKLPPLDAFREHGVAMAIATDCNPGTSPLLSLRQAMQLACTHFRLTPEEALRGATVHAARALGLRDRGVLRVGVRADFVRWQRRPPVRAVLLARRRAGWRRRGWRATRGPDRNDIHDVSSATLPLDADTQRNSHAPSIAIACSLLFSASTQASPAPAAARQLAQDAIIVDTHIDCAHASCSKQWADLGVATPQAEFDYPRAREGGLDVAFMSIYTSPDEDDTARPGRWRTRRSTRSKR